MSSKIAKAILRLTPEAQFVVRGTPENYEVEWHSEDIAQPSTQDIAGSLAVVEGLAYQEQRAVEYPPITDQLDALWKGGEAAAEMLAKVQAVKAKYPKPTE